jgi:flagellar biosynthesis/type III secretory pathway M-ring protein FliF/YscJ
VRQQLETVLRRVGGLDTTAKLLVGSLLVVLLMGLFLVAQYAGRPDLIPLAITASAQEEVKRFLSERRIDHEIDSSGRVMVPSTAHASIISQLSEQGVGGGSGIDFDALVAMDNPFETMRQTEQKKLIALQNVLARTIRGFHGVASATVMIAPRPAAGLGASATPQSASVHVTMKPGQSLTQSQVDAIAELVAGSQAGLKPERVAIADPAGPRKPRAGRDRLAGENLEHQNKVAEAVRDRIGNLLAHIPGVLISVNPQVVTKTRQSSETSFGEGIFAPTSESRFEQNTRGQTPMQAPGTRPNVGMSIADSSRASNATTERQETRFATRIPETHRSEFDPTGYAVRIDVSVAIPWSHFRRVWQLLAGPEAASAQPDEAQLARVRDEEIARIRKLLEPMTNTDAAEEAKPGTVEVSWFYDFDGGLGGDLNKAGVGGSGLMEAISPAAGGSLVKNVALGGLALVALGMMLMMVRKAGERPALPSASELSGMPPTLDNEDAELVGEADESNPPLEGMELDDDSLRRQQMLGQLNEIVRSNPAETAALLKRWVKAAG